MHRLILSFMLLFGVSSAPAAEPSVWDKVDFPEAHFDGREWELGFENAAPAVLTREYVLKGEKAESWTERVTHQLMRIDPNTDLDNYAATTQKMLAQSCPGLSWRIIESSPDSLLYEWSVQNCAGQSDQSELAYVFPDRDGVYVLRYAIKKAPLPADKMGWLAHFKNTALKPTKNAPPTAADLNNFFIAPKEWLMMPSGQKAASAFQTSAQKENSLLVLVRPVLTSQTPSQWAEDEASILKQKGGRILEKPSAATYGGVPFVSMASANEFSGLKIRVEQHFCAYPADKAVIEVAVMGPEAFFTVERRRINEFLKSFKFN